MLLTDPVYPGLFYKHLGYYSLSNSWFVEIFSKLYMAQISEGGEDSEGMSYFLKLWDLNMTRNDLLCILGLLLQFNDTNASMDLEQN